MQRKTAPARRVTIVDVARHAGVSTTAVSKVLRNAYGTSPAMRVRVRAAIDELGYRPSAAARALRGQTYTLGVMLPEVRNPFFADVLDGVAEQLRGTEYQPLITCNDETGEVRVTDAMVDRGMDGVLLVAPVSSRRQLERVARTVPTVVVGGYDNTTFAAFGPISLTTVDQAGHQIGVSAARLLLNRIADRARPIVQVRLAPALVVRRTTGSPAA